MPKKTKEPWYERAADISSVTATSPILAGSIGAIAGGMSSKGMEDTVRRYLALRGGIRGRLRYWLAKHIVRSKRRDPRFIALSALIGGATAGAGALAGRLLHGRAMEYRMRHGQAATGPEKRMLSRWRNG